MSCLRTAHASEKLFISLSVTSLIQFYIAFLFSFLLTLSEQLLNPLNAELNPHLPFANITRRFNVYGSVHRKYIPIYIQQDAKLHSLFISGNCSTGFVWYFHTSSGAHTTVSTASGICRTVTAICRYRRRVGTGWSVLLLAYATHSTLKPVPTLPR
jgi:hypothetical protein